MSQAEQSKEQIYQADRRRVWHALAPHNERNPWVVESAQGVYVTDLEGRTYLDAMAGLWCVNIGYGHERIAKAAYEQMRKLPFYPLSAAHVPATELAETLTRWLGGDYRFFFSNSGSEANETALKVARQYHAQMGHSERYKVISRYRAYHGNTMGALSATGQHQRKYLYEPLAVGFLHIQPPDLYRLAEGRAPEEYGKACADELERVIQWEGPDTISAFIMEPIITGGGMLVPPDNYLPEVAKVCKRHGVLLIVDEVISGFGRTGKRFGFQHSSVTPDIVTMAKGITSGYAPLSATAVAGHIYEAFKDVTDPNAHLRQVNTFGGHPVSCAVALENLAIMEELDLAARSAVLGDMMLRRLKELYAYGIVGDVRGKGLLAGIELVANRDTKEPLPLERVKAVVARTKSLGVIVGRNGDTVAGLNNVVTVSPPLTIAEEEIDQIVEALTAAIAEEDSNNRSND